MLVTQLCPTLCSPMDYSPPGFSVHGNSQARTLEWVADSFSQEIFLTQGLNPALLHCRQTLLPSEPPGKPQQPTLSDLKYEHQSALWLTCKVKVPIPAPRPLPWAVAANTISKGVMSVSLIYWLYFLSIVNFGFSENYKLMNVGSLNQWT